jgi:hypothetical protein
MNFLFLFFLFLPLGNGLWQNLLEFFINLTDSIFICTKVLFFQFFGLVAKILTSHIGRFRRWRSTCG